MKTVPVKAAQSVSSAPLPQRVHSNPMPQQVPSFIPVSHGVDESKLSKNMIDNTEADDMSETNADELERQAREAENDQFDSKLQGLIDGLSTESNYMDTAMPGENKRNRHEASKASENQPVESYARVKEFLSKTMKKTR